MWNNWTDAPVRHDRRFASGSDDEVKLQKELRIYLFISTLQEQKKKKNKCSPQSRKLRGALSLSPWKVKPSVFLHKFALTAHLNSYNVQLLVKSQSNGSNSFCLDILRWGHWLCLSSKWAQNVVKGDLRDFGSWQLPLKTLHMGCIHLAVSTR